MLLSSHPARGEEGPRVPPLPIGADCWLIARAELEDGRCWYQRCGDQPEQALGCDLSAMRQVVALSASPGCDRLAVLSVGEGHPWLEVVDLTVLREQGSYRVIGEVNPYPLGLEVIGWRGRDLWLRSEIALDVPPDAASSAEARVLDQHAVFILRDAAAPERSNQPLPSPDAPCPSPPAD